MIKRMPLWLKMGLSSAFLSYISTGLILFIIGCPKWGISFQNLINSLFFPFYGDGIFFLIPLLCALIGGVIGFIYENFFYHNSEREVSLPVHKISKNLYFHNLKEKISLPIHMVEQTPLWLKIGLSFVFLTYASLVFVLFMIARSIGGDGLFWEDLIGLLIYIFSGCGIFLFILLLYALIGKVIGLIYEKFFYHSSKEKVSLPVYKIIATKNQTNGVGSR